jgi:hypothetical protein
MFPWQHGSLFFTLVKVSDQKCGTIHQIWNLEQDFTYFGTFGYN